MPFIKKSELNFKDEKIQHYQKNIDIFEKFVQYVYHHNVKLFYDAQYFMKKNYGEEVDPPYKSPFSEEKVKEVKIKLKEYSIYKDETS